MPFYVHFHAVSTTVIDWRAGQSSLIYCSKVTTILPFALNPHENYASLLDVVLPGENFSR